MGIRLVDMGGLHCRSFAKLSHGEREIVPQSLTAPRLDGEFARAATVRFTEVTQRKSPIATLWHGSVADSLGSIHRFFFNFPHKPYAVFLRMLASAKSTHKMYVCVA